MSMTDQTVDDKAVIERVRERLRTRLAEAAVSPVPPRPDAPVDRSATAVDAELALMAETSDIGNVPLTSYRKLFGPVLTVARRLARKLFAGAVEQQVSYNTANQRLARALRQELDALRKQQEVLRQRCDVLEAAVERMRGKVEGG